MTIGFFLSKFLKRKFVFHVHPIQIILVFSYLAWDILLSAFANLLFFSKLQQIQIPIQEKLIFLFSISLLYGLDRIWDAKRERMDNRTTRGQFFRKNIHVLQFYYLLHLPITLILLYQLGWENAFLQKSVLVVLLGLVLALCQWVFWLPREIWVSLVYTLGFIYPLSPWSWAQGTLLLGFGLHVFVAVILSSGWDRDWDKKQGVNTLATRLTPKGHRYWVFVCFSLGLVVLVLSLFGEKNLVPTVFLFFSYIWLGISCFFPSRIGKKIWAELSYLPLLLSSYLL